MTAAVRPSGGVVALIAAVLLPPLGVFLARGLGTAFWITVLLTLVAWVPGILFALVVILNPRLLDSPTA